MMRDGPSPCPPTFATSSCASRISRSRRLAPALALALSACASLGGRPPATAPLADADVRRSAALLAAADARTADSALLRAGLQARHPRVRRLAVRVAGQLHDAGAAPALRRLLADPDTGVAAEAAFALGLLRDSSSAAALAAVVHVAAPLAPEAAWSLGEIGTPARGAIVAALAAPAGVEARIELLLAASRLRPVPIDAIRPYLSRAQPLGVAWAAAYAIARPRAPAGVRALLDIEPGTRGDTMWVACTGGCADGYAAAGDLLAELRSQIARGLARPAAGDSLAAPALAMLARLTSDPSPHVRINAARALGTYGSDARRPLLGLLRDADANVRIAVAQSLAGVLPDQRAAWRDVWAADTSLAFRREVIAAAIHAGVVLPAIDEDDPENWQHQADWRMRAAVAEAGGSATIIERVVEVSLPLTRDRDGRVRAAAYGAFTPWLDTANAEAHPWRRAFVMPALHDDDPFVRATVLGGLVGSARASEVPAVLASYRLAQADTPNDARLAAIRYLAAAWRRDSAAFPDSLRAALQALDRPRDPLVRAEAAGVAPFAHWTAADGTVRPAAWYERIVRASIGTPGAAPPMADIVTERGVLTLELFASDAPLTVDNFLALARAGYYAGARFHRVVPNFVAQDGDPRGDGNGGPGYAIRDELNRRRYRRGAVGMALSGPDTGGSQYFIALSPQPHLDGHYTVFGRVVRGFDVLDSIVRDDRIERIDIR